MKMGSDKPHAICIPYPAQGHVNPFLTLAKLLHFKGFHVTFVNTEFNHKRLVNSRGPDAVKGLDDFQFKTIPDGMPPSDPGTTQDIPALCESIRKNCIGPFRDLIKKLNESTEVPNVTCIVSDGVMSFTLEAAEELGIPEVVFFTSSACGALGYIYYAELVKRGYVPFKDESYFTNGYLDTVIDWIPGMKGIRIRDFPTFIRTTNPDEIMVNFNIEQYKNASKANGLLLNTFDDLEHEVLEEIRSKYENVYTIGPLHLLSCQIPENEVKSISSSLWEEDMGCLDWLDKREPGSVIYVNFGSITTITPQQFCELSWGLANSNLPFFWVIRQDLVTGDSAVLPEEFLEEIKGRGLLASWSPQEQVVVHPSVGVFLTHNGWNSTLESISAGVPMISWPFFAEQQTNCRYVCNDWAIGLEMDNNVTRENVEGLVREMMEGEKGKKMRKRALEWKEKAHVASKTGGSSFQNFEKMIKEVLEKKTNLHF
ncbi:hypothetical protein GIB67_016990 [Kingdonia uniflora]|uniref:Glycosyltransferase N-terminal domain-containing protein n=1 Tax=Kingdonia uniflora TaxID=39325 RepID=A0A7J7M3M7_9MAGN|nr:hypothetical protein GIB67_016990 [Kingdonia uniflora]